MVRSGALPLEWGESTQTHSSAECYGRLVRVGDVPGLPGQEWGCVLFVGKRRSRIFFAGVFKSHVFLDTQD